MDIFYPFAKNSYRMVKKMHNVIIIGSGPAGLTAALYTARANLNPIVLAGWESGGQLMLTTEIENFPGFPNGIAGPDLMANMRKQAEKFGAKIIDENATTVDFSQRPFKVTNDSGEVLEAQSVIIATGASAKWLNIPSETKLRGRGVSSCATCDGYFFKGKDLVIVGGGDTAMEEALFLANLASSVTVVHRREEFRASKVMQDRVLSHEKIKVMYNHTVDEILGANVVEGVRLKNTQTGELTELPIAGVFIAIGHHPNTELFKGQLEMDETGYIIPKEHTQTSIPGVFVAGDVRDQRYRQAITAAAEGAKAALDVEKYLIENPVD